MTASLSFDVDIFKSSGDFSITFAAFLVKCEREMHQKNNAASQEQAL